MAIKDLGIVTAYGYARAGGYEGTEQEFKELLASMTDAIDSVVEFTDPLNNGNIVVNLITD